MTHAATKWWLFGGVLLVAGLGIVLYQGYRAGTFVFFGGEKTAQDRATQTVQYLPPTGGGTCWTFQSYANQEFIDASYESCIANPNWVGWVQAGRQIYSSFGTYNPSPDNLDWSDHDGICLLTNGSSVLNTLYECITQYKAEPNRWDTHYSANEIQNPDLGDNRSAARPTLVAKSSDRGGQKQAIVSIDKVIGYCYGATGAGTFELRKTRADCETLYQQYKDDTDPDTVVSSWCPSREETEACVLFMVY